MEKTFVMLRPGAIKRGLVPEIVARLMENGINIEYCELKQLKKEDVIFLYQQLLWNGFPQDRFDKTMKANIAGPALGLIVSGENVIERVTKLKGPRKYKDDVKDPTCIRSLGDPTNDAANLIHSSDSLEEAMEEATMFFGEDILSMFESPTKHI